MIGKIIRKTSIDELPQLINVLRGEMSIVGNRPLPLYEAEKLTCDDWAKRFMAPAGLTGLWQVDKRGKDNLSAEERIRLDMNYADNYSFLLPSLVYDSLNSSMVNNPKPIGYGISDDNYELLIFNRWGEVLFHTTSQTESWDGTYKGEKVEEGAYNWRIKGITKQDEEDYEKIGHIAVINKL
mgnify:CR=1 FL=1